MDIYLVKLSFSCRECVPCQIYIDIQRCLFPCFLNVCVHVYIHILICKSTSLFIDLDISCLSQRWLHAMVSEYLFTLKINKYLPAERESKFSVQTLAFCNIGISCLMLSLCFFENKRQTAKMGSAFCHRSRRHPIVRWLTVSSQGEWNLWLFSLSLL